jgi:DNA processing protein
MRYKLSPPQSASEKLAWMRLIASENVGPRTFFQVMAHFGSASKALAGIGDLALKGGKKNIRLAVADKVRADASGALKQGIKILFYGEAAYPRLLTKISDPPPVLYTLGDVSLLNRPTMGIVGARNGSANGRQLAHKLARFLGEDAFVVVSGLARGIDASAHEGGLETGTIGVVAGGVDVVYPPENDNLYKDIGASGLIISEQPMGVVPKARHFPRRNRLVSGMCQGLVVVEASLKSGTLITAQYALDQNREVMAVPGSPLDPRAAGTNKLIKEGAHILTKFEDATAMLEKSHEPLSLFDKADVSSGDFMKPVLSADIDKARPLVHELLGFDPTSLNDIARLSRQPLEAVLIVLLELELAGRLDRLSGDRVCLIDPMG